eukprot:2987718-Amphidinium_carterae.2
MNQVESAAVVSSQFALPLHSVSPLSIATLSETSARAKLLASAWDRATRDFSARLSAHKLPQSFNPLSIQFTACQCAYLSNLLRKAEGTVVSLSFQRCSYSHFTFVFMLYTS